MSADEFSDDDEPPAKQIHLTSSSSLDLSTTTLTNASSSCNRSNKMQEIAASEIEKLLVKKLEQIIATQDQQTIMLDQILRQQTAQNVSQLQRPDDFPILPVTNKTDYRAVECFLSSEEKLTYMVSK